MLVTVIDLFIIPSNSVTSKYVYPLAAKSQLGGTAPLGGGKECWGGGWRAAGGVFSAALFFPLAGVRDINNSSM